MVSPNVNSVASKFGYNGVELEESLGLNLHEMDFRMYDPAIGRFNGIDPVTHHSQGTSVAFDNNPIFLADPSGADALSDVSSGSYTGAAARRVFNSIVSNLGPGGANDPEDCPKGEICYEIFNAMFIGDKLNLRRPSKDYPYEDIVGYGYDPKDQAKYHIDALYDAINALEDDKLKLRLLKRLGVVGKKASKIIKFLSSRRYDAISSLVGLTSNNDFLANAPFPVGTMVDILDDPLQQINRETDHMIRWDNAMSSFESLLGIEDFNNIVIIYSNELLTTTSTISSEDSRIINSPHTITKWKYANIATQYGNDMYILKTHELKN